MQKEKGISMLVGIIIILVAAVIIFGGVFAWQYFVAKPQIQKPNARILLGDVYPLYSNLKWDNPVAKTENYNNLALKGYEVNSQIVIKNGSTPMNVFSFYDQKLKSLGWTDAVYFDADGVLGHQVGYMKGNNYISLGYSISKEKVTSQPNQPLQFTYPYTVTYSIFAGTTPGNNSQTNSASWKTYKNDTYGFEFQYPASLEINQPTSKSTCEIGNGAEPSCEIIPFYEILGEIIDHKFDDEIVWTKENIQRYYSGDGESKNVIIDGIGCNEYEFVTGVNYKIHGLQIPLDGNYFLQIEENSKMPVLNNSDWEHIKSTFKFTK